METNTSPTSSDLTPQWLTTPLAIMIAGVMISASILYAGGVGNGGAAAALKAAQLATPAPAGAPTTIKDPSTLLGPNDPSEGSSNAKVTIVEFSDFECPYCRQFFNDTYPLIKQQYIDTGKVRFVHRNFPLPFHDAATPAALAGKCAQEQGKFWEYYATIFSQQQKKESDPKIVTKTIEFGIKDIKAWVLGLGLNMNQFNSCLDAATYASQVQADTTAGSTAGVTGTPTFFVNGEMIVGAQEFPVFKDAIDRALSK